MTNASPAINGINALCFPSADLRTAHDEEAERARDATRTHQNGLRMLYEPR